MTRRDAAPALRGAIVARTVVASFVASVAFVVTASQAVAQSACAAAVTPAARVAPRHWPAPLDRQVTLEGNNVTLRDGLARLANAQRRA